MKAVERPGIEPPPPTDVCMKLARLRGSVLQRLDNIEGLHLLAY